MNRMLSCMIIAFCIPAMGRGADAAIGVESRLTYRSVERLQVKKLNDKSSIWLRIIREETTPSGHCYTIGCIGNEVGTFDIAGYLEATTGSDVSLPPRMMTFYASLPSDHVVGVVQKEPIRIPRFGFTQSILRVIAIVWLSLPLWLVVRRIRRHMNRPRVEPEMARSPLDLLMPLLNKGARQTLSIQEIAFMERLVRAHVTADHYELDEQDVDGIKSQLEVCLYGQGSFDQQRVLRLARMLVQRVDVVTQGESIS